jgi:hypothetical protein
MTKTTDSNTMSKSHAIQVPQEFAQELWRKFNTRNDVLLFDSWRDVLNCAAQWGHDQREPELQKRADQEVDVCCEWLTDQGYGPTSERLRAAMRPKPPSLAEQGMAALQLGKFPYTKPIKDLRAALTRLAELENQQ